jgi:hypothetical protein
MRSAIARLLALFSSQPPRPPLVPVGRRIAGASAEEALHRFEDAFSDENFQSVAIRERIERADGLLVHYEVRWKYSVFDDATSGRHESWALLVPADPAAGDPPAARFRVGSATQDHHVKLQG